MREKVLVTGANGFLGNHIVRKVLEQNMTPTALVRPGSDISVLEGLDCSIVRGTYKDTSFLEELIQDHPFVIHCASLTSQNVTDFNIYEKANIDTCKVLVKVCRKKNIKRFVYISSANCFTNGTKEDPGNEDSGFMPWLKNSGYAYSKYLAQEYILGQVTINDFPAVVVAPTFMLGDYDSKPSSGQLTRYILRNKIVFYPEKGGKSFVAVESVAQAVVNALTKGRVGACYLLAGENMTYLEYYKQVASINQQKKWFLPIPGFLRNFIAALPGEKARLLETNLQMLFLANYFSNQKARKELQMPDFEMDTSIRKTIKGLNRLSS